MWRRCFLILGRQFWWGRICAQKLSELQHATCPSSHVDIPLRCGRHFDEVTSACKSCRKYNMKFARVNRWTSTSLKSTPGSSKKTANQLEVWRGELDTPGPPISMLCDRSAWRSLQKNSQSCSGHWEAMVSNIETGGPGASGGCWNFLVGGCFFWRTRYDDFLYGIIWWYTRPFFFFHEQWSPRLCSTYMIVCVNKLFYM